MADAVLSTSISPRTITRRSMMAGAAALTAPAFPVPAIAAPPAAVADAELLRRIRVVERRRAACDVADAEYDRLYDAMCRHPDFAKTTADTVAARAVSNALTQRFGLPAAEADLDRLYRRYEAATEAAFEAPARTLPGLLSKIRLGVTVVKERHPYGYEHIDCECLDVILADLERIAAVWG